jgi:tetrahydromethanopterin S-methyltransferase subunit F
MFDALEAGDFQSIERIRDGAQMLGREMQVDEGVLQPGMSE